MSIGTRISQTRVVHRIQEFNRIAEIEELARRYFTLNSFDGILTTLGIIIANFFAGVTSSAAIITSSVGAATAVAISGFYGAYITEKAERAGKIKRLEKNIGLSLHKTQIAAAHRFAIVVLAIIEGMSPFIIAVAIISPFIIMEEIKAAYYTSFGIAAFALFLIGIFLGRISKENVIKSGIKMVVVGLFCMIVVLAVEKLFGG